MYLLGAVYPLWVSGESLRLGRIPGGAKVSVRAMVIPPQICVGAANLKVNVKVC